LDTFLLREIFERLFQETQIARHTNQKGEEGVISATGAIVQYDAEVIVTSTQWEALMGYFKVDKEDDTNKTCSFENESQIILGFPLGQYVADHIRNFEVVVVSNERFAHIRENAMSEEGVPVVSLLPL